jgi:hypothetical protein
VWHKEILWALHQGVAVYGSASMGALRAAELAEFGVVGVGKVFEAFAAGHLEDDDEVAVVHGPPESGYRRLSEALVNIRATLASATAARIIDVETQSRLLRRAKALHYSQRTYSRLLEAIPCAALHDWLPIGRIDVKRADAFRMLEAIRERRDAPTRAAGPFEATVFWENALVEMRNDLAACVADELMLAGQPAGSLRHDQLASLVRAALLKKGVLAMHDAADADLAQLELSVADLVAWFVATQNLDEGRLRDLERTAETSPRELIRALTRQYVYVHCNQDSQLEPR